MDRIKETIKKHIIISSIIIGLIIEGVIIIVLYIIRANNLLSWESINTIGAWIGIPIIAVYLKKIRKK